MGIKRLFILSAVMLATAVARADGLVACIYHNGDLQEKVLLSKKPVLKMEGASITMQIAESQSLEIPAVGTVVKFEDASDPASINTVENTHSVPAYKITGSEVSISGLTPGEMVRIYSISGQQLSSARVDDSGSVSMPLGKGIMVLHAGKTSIKLINK